MAIQQKELEKIKEVVTEVISGTEKRFDDKLVGLETRFDDKLVGLEERLSKKIEDEVGSLAIMTAKEFNVVHSEIAGLKQDLKNHKNTHEFDISELVHKSDFHQLKERVNRLEEKV